jgi:cysteinyl-tRNA synthetase
MKVFNTLTGRKTEFQPVSDIVTMYVCGVTVYDDCHIGHAMSYIIFDAVKRYLEFKGYNVKHAQNFTDIDDKIIGRANKLKISSSQLSNKYIDEYFADMDALNIKRATVYPKATEEIPVIIEMIQGLVNKDYAYESQGSVYFRVKHFPEYGKLSHQKVDQMVSESTNEAGDKDSPLDFALWKATKPDEPSWPSPWGNGRPGWHIECSAMSLKYLGKNIDIHGGGLDLVFPHHENEITQSESFTGVAPFVKYWMHNGLLQFSGDKMSKSLGNLITIKEALKRYSSDGLRLFILSSHYRSPLTYSEDNVKASESGIDRLRQAVKKNDKPSNDKPIIDSKIYRQRFIDSMDDDFNTAQAIAVIFELVREINRNREENMDVSEAQATLLELTSVLGFTLVEPSLPELDAEPLIGLLISLRNDMRQIKQWQLADKIRNQLIDLGVILEDTPQGTTWKRNR